MSNYVKATVETLKDLDSEYFMRAMDAMGFAPDFKQKKIDTYWKTVNCDCVLCNAKSGESMNIGLSFISNPDKTVQVSVQADWDLSKGYSSAGEFMERFVLEYHTAKYSDVCAKMGFVMESAEELENGRRKLVMRRAA